MRSIVILTLCFVLGLFPVFAQEAGKFRTGFEIGYCGPPHGEIGLLQTIELKYNLQNNMSVGLNEEVALMIKNKSYNANVFSLSVTYDYYFHSESSRFSPFIGTGLGYYFCVVEHFADGLTKFNNPGCSFRVGFELSKFRMSVNYNLNRKTSKKNEWIYHNDYISFNTGFYLGGGKWKK